MKRTITVVVAASALAVAGLAVAATSTVALTKSGPQPPAVTVEWGDTVSFVNEDSTVHRVAVPRLGLQSGDLPTGSRYDVPFAVRAGTYGFRQQGGTAVNGEVVVRVSGKVTLTASRTSVPYRASVRLAGRSTQQNSSVVIQRRPFGGAGDWEDARTVQPGGDGAFATTFSQTEGYSYRALAAGAQLRSSTVSVTVTPTVRAIVRSRRVAAGETLTVVGRILPANAASNADLETFDPRRNAWRNVDNRAVRKGVVTLRWAVQAGVWRVRVAIRRGSTAPGFDAASSPAIRVVGIATG